jgi:Nif-specific regulatory protein
LQPGLIVAQGPLQAGVLSLTSAETVIGRNPTSGIFLDDPTVSRQHCAIRVQDGEFTLHDLGSRTGTFVNGQRKTEHVLQDGDHITVGASIFVFTCRPKQDATTLVLHDDTPGALQAEPPVSIYAADTWTWPASTGKDRVAHDCAALLQIVSKIGEIRNSESLLWQLSGMLFDLVPADRVSILRCRGGSPDLEPAAAWDRVNGPAALVTASRTVVEHVASTRAAVFVNDLASSPMLERAKSLQSMGVSSVLCVPLVLGDTLFGVIYLDSRAPVLDATHLHLCTAVAAVTALALQNAWKFESLESENQQLRAKLDLNWPMIGESPAMKDVQRFVAKVAPGMSTVLVLGESGTGKELVAGAIHQLSPRRDRPFIAINCAALTETLLESEMFGYEKGAFTGAASQRKGHFEVADGGTVFLDEIGELAPALQAKLLRVLQERELVRVGGSRPIKVDVRVLAATNRDLAALVQANAFRRDLYYRLNVVSFRLPALRERRDDVPLLANHFAERYGRRCGRCVTGVSDAAMKALVRYEWPGNIRELQNAIERAVVLGSADSVLPEDLPEELVDALPGASGGALDYHSALADKKRALITDALRMSDGNYTEAARKLGLHPNYLHRLIRILDLRSTVQKNNA